MKASRTVMPFKPAAADEAPAGGLPGATVKLKIATTA
jgi:hypothetical protein